MSPTIRLADTKLTRCGTFLQAPVSFAAHPLREDGRSEEFGL
jgi:hypothetical protein